MDIDVNNADHSQHLCSSNLVPGTTLSAFLMLSHLIFTETVWNSYYYLHFTDE